MTRTVRTFIPRDVILVLAVFLYSFSAGSAAGTNYYVDSQDGSDSNSGTSENDPWKTLANVSYPEYRTPPVTFQPGDRILFKRGCTWTGCVLVKHSGMTGNPIVYSDYGEGAAPVLTNPGTNYQRTVDVLDGAGYILIENLMLQDTHEAGVFVRAAAHDVTVRNCEMTRVGVGVYLVGSNNLVEDCNFHDLTMVLNTKKKAGDDYGAVGVNINNSDNEVRYCTFRDCVAKSFDYGTDGGAVEIYAWLTDSRGNNINVDNIKIHHNYALRTNGFTEIGGISKTPAFRVTNVKIYHNIWEDTAYDLSMMIHYGGSFGVDIENIQVDNNTIVQHNDGVRPIIWGLIGFSTGANPWPRHFSMRNNIIFSEWIQQIVRNGANIGSEHNIIFSTQPATTLGFTAHETDLVWINPLLIKSGSWGALDKTTNNFRLQAGSPAIDSGADLGYKVDLDDISIPQGATPDRGAYEFVAGPPLLDTVPPEILGSGPSGLIPLDANGEVTMWVETDEPTRCWYSVDEVTWLPLPPEGYVEYHEVNLSGLIDGQNYIYYFRAWDEAGNYSNVITITFSIAQGDDTIPPVLTIISPEENAIFPAGISVVNFHCTTNEPAVCAYWDGDSWEFFTTENGYNHYVVISGHMDGESYTYSVYAMDQDDNTSEAVIQFTILESVADQMAHYTFEHLTQDRQIIDVSSNGNFGTPNGDADLVSGGIDGFALALDGDGDWIEIPDSASLDIPSAITLEAWVYPRSNNGILIQKSNAYSLSLVNGYPQLSLYLFKRLQTVAADTSLVFGQWNQIAGTYDSATKVMRIYVNASSTAKTLPKLPRYTIDTNSNPVYIGVDFHGFLDEVRVFNRALSDAEIEARFE